MSDCFVGSLLEVCFLIAAIGLYTVIVRAKPARQKNLDNLPIEIQLKIAECLRYGNASTPRAMADLAALALVCRSLARPTQRVLYKAPYIPSHDTAEGSPNLPFLRTVANNPFLLSHIRHLDITMVIMSRDESHFAGAPLNVLEKYDKRRQDLGEETFARLSSLGFGEPSQLYHVLTQRGPDVTWVGMILEMATSLCNMTLRIVHEDGSLISFQSLEILYGLLIREKLRHNRGGPRHLPLAKPQSFCISGEDICGADVGDPFLQKWSPSLWPAALENSVLNHATVWEVDCKKRNVIAHYRTVANMEMHHLGEMTRMELLIQDGSELCDPWGNPRTRKSSRSFKNVVLKLQPFAWRLRQLRIRAQTDDADSGTPAWLAKISRARTMRQFTFLESLSVPQDFLFKRHSKPGVLKFRPIHRFLPFEHLREIVIEHATEDLRMWLEALVLFLSQINKSDFVLGSIQIGVNEEVENSFPSGWYRGSPFWDDFRELNIEISFFQMNC
ncbi:unnamed protein product [Periconia digitata]|uniref:F-box domain-containing protein n=1 Tax=Periconia digitata TaxID=1303443 RepID=A0A9W4UTN6_9PLEO|nr:unnamed protein product [Periconia digitata]